MWNQNLLESLKLIASICTPLAIAGSGILINRTIQRQNAAAQRQSSWLVTWADDFLKTASGFNDAATNLLLVYWQLATSDFANDKQEELNKDIRSHFLELVRGEWQMLKHADFAQQNGKNLEEAAKALVEEARNWGKSKGGSVQLFRQKQLAFNANARKVHAELLGLGHP